MVVLYGPDALHGEEAQALMEEMWRLIPPLSRSDLVR
jgi:hypothetical protein